MNVFSPPVTRGNLLTEERSYPIDATNPGCTPGLALALAASASQYRNNVQHARSESSGRLRVSTSKWQFSPPTGRKYYGCAFWMHTRWTVIASASAELVGCILGVASESSEEQLRATHHRKPHVPACSPRQSASPATSPVVIVSSHRQFHLYTILEILIESDLPPRRGREAPRWGNAHACRSHIQYPSLVNQQMRIFTT